MYKNDILRKHQEWKEATTGTETRRRLERIKKNGRETNQDKEGQPQRWRDEPSYRGKTPAAEGRTQLQRGNPSCRGTNPATQGQPQLQRNELSYRGATPAAE